MIIPVVLTLVAIPIVLYAIIKYIEYNARRSIINIHTKKPIDNMVGLIPSFGMFLSKQHTSFGRYETTKEFNYKPFLSFLGTNVLLNVSQPELAKKVLLNWRLYEKMKPDVTPDLKRVTGHSVVFANGEDWKAQRQIMNPAFFNVDRFANQFSIVTKECLRVMSEMLKTEETLPIPSLMTALTLDILGVTTFGHDFNYLREACLPPSKIPSESALNIKAYEYVMTNMVTVSKILLQGSYKSLAKKESIEFDSSLKRLEDLMSSMIQKSRLRSKNQVVEENYTETLLDMMVAANDSDEGSKMDDALLRDNALVIFIAGHDTTSNTLCYALYSLCKYPETQTKLLQEIKDKVGMKSEPTVEQIDGMDYLNMFIKENLRLNGPLDNIPPKTLNEDAVLGDYQLKKGVSVAINSYAIHRNKQIWGQDAEEFRPERFSEAESKGRHSNAYIPFSAGPRTCMGNRFSLLEQKIFLVSLLQKFELSLPDQDYVCKPQSGDVMYFAARDLRLTFKKRE
ncbi:cytochrome P450 [Acrasis kona]|uniref:Cytochrome P450 n=1 Tax=Acrasis kona TaxID=1008807 RepID=A0AAW2ZQT9_9EUKA